MWVKYDGTIKSQPLLCYSLSALWFTYCSKIGDFSLVVFHKVAVIKLIQLELLLGSVAY